MTGRLPGCLAVLPALLAAGLLAGCQQVDPLASDRLARDASSPGTQTAEAALRPGSADAIDRALANPRRSPADLARDQARHASAVLDFFGIAPGMAVLDLFSGGGYYTELVAYIVGPQGRVVAHNNPAFEQRARREIERRYQPGRLRNVTQLVVDNNRLDLAPAQFDAALMILAFHDLYATDPAGGEATDVPRLLRQVYAALKPGGVLGVVDHAAVPGSPPATGGSLHRIDEGLVVRQLTAAGFLLESRSDILRHPEDDRSRLALAPDLRGRTDRFVLRFRKPW